jgi:hypothetical protein
MKRALATTAVHHGKKGTNRPVCISCSDSFDKAAHVGCFMECPAGHHMCPECSPVYVESIMSETSSALPPKCPICRGEIPCGQFERLLNDEQMQAFLNHMCTTTLQEGEKLCACTSCSYFEIRVDEPPLFFCTNCGSNHCMNCKATLPVIEEEDYEDNTADEKQQAIERHFICATLRTEKAIVEEAIEAGNTMSCPGCGLRGRKDDSACMHMLCSSCSTVWCYFCGLSEATCDKATREGVASVEPIYGHNEDWQTNPLRCPMYLTTICEVDPEWPDPDEFGYDSEDDEDDENDEDVDADSHCLNYFHRIRTLKLLHAAREKVGATTFQQLRHHFPSIREIGFSAKEIRSGPLLELLRRPNQSKKQQIHTVDLTVEEID